MSHSELTDCAGISEWSPAGNLSFLEKDRDAKDSFLTIFGPSLLPLFSVASLPVAKGEIKFEPVQCMTVR